jgi:superfamily II DNA or RNA helicase
MLQITISNNIRLRGVTVPLRAAITQALTLPNPEYAKLKRMRKPTYGIDQQLRLYIYDADGSLVTPRGFIGELLEILKTQGYRPENVIRYSLNEPQAVDFGPWIGPQLRDYQEPAVADAIAKGGVLISPAGSGKTLMGCRIIQGWGLPALWLTHTKDLLYQSAENAKKYLGGVGQVGIIGDGKITWGSGKLIVATVQTLNANPTLVSTLNSLIGTLVVDEAHHFPAQQFIEVAGKFAAQKLLGLTATPDRKDGLERYMFLGLGPACHEVQRDGMYEAGAIILPEVKFVFTDFGADTGYDGALDEDDQAENNVDAGGEDLDYAGLMKELTEDQARAKLVAENILDSCIAVNPKGGAVIVLADNVRYLFTLRSLVERFAKVRWGVLPRMAVVHGGLSQYTWHKATKAQAARLERDGHEVRHNERLGRWEVKVEQYTDAEVADWQVTKTQRLDIMARAKGRQLDVLFATSQLVKEGLDIPHLYAGHLATPQRGDGKAASSRSGAGVEQAIGRIMRPDPKNPDKKATWYDYVDFNVGTFADQYYSRRSVYRRLGIKLPTKRKTKRKMIEDFLVSGGPFSGSLPL